MEHVDQQKPFITSSAFPSGVPTRKSANYKPRMLRWPALVTLLITTLALVGLIEYAFYTLPAADSLGTIEGDFSTTTVVRRDEGYVSTVVTKVQGSPETLVVTYSPPQCGPTSISPGMPPIACAPPPQYWLPVGTITLGPSITTYTIPATPTSSDPASSAPPPQFWLSVGPSTITTTITPTPTPGAPAPQFWLETGQELVEVFTNAEYFVGAFLSTIVAVLFSIPWVTIDSKVRALEPFHQLAGSQGARASKTFYMDYTSPFFLVAPIKALSSGHWAPFVTSILSMSTILVVPLAPEFVSVRMAGSCDSLHTGCVPSLSTFPLVGRILEGVLVLMAIGNIVLIVILSKYTTGVFSEPHSISGLAVLFANQEVKSNFRDAALANSGTKKPVHEELAQQRFRVDFYTDQNGFGSCGLVPLIPSYQYPWGNFRDTYQEHEYQPAHPLQANHPHRKFALGLIVVLVGLAVLSVYYKLEYNPNSGFERFMDSEGFGVRFLFTLVGVIISRYWTGIFQDIASMYAFSRLSRRSAKAQDSILIPKRFHPITSILPTLLRGHFFIALVAFSAFLAEPLTICLANIHFKTGTTFAAFTVSVWLTCAIIAVMLLTLVAIAFHKEPALPFKPNTIAACLYLLSFSSLPSRLEGLATLDTKARNRAIRKLDLRYGMWNRGIDGVATIDVEPSLS